MRKLSAKIVAPIIGSVITMSLCCFALYFYVMNFIVFGSPTGLFQEIFEGRDPFYSGSGELAIERIPLIKPYQLYCLTGADDRGWTISSEPPFTRDKHDFTVVINIEKMGYENGIFIFYSPSPTPPGYKEQVKYNWFVIIPEKDIEKGFDSEESLEKYIHTHEFNNLEWMPVDDVFMTYLRTGCLSWIPGCKESN